MFWSHVEAREAKGSRNSPDLEGARLKVDITKRQHPSQENNDFNHPGAGDKFIEITRTCLDSPNVMELEESNREDYLQDNKDTYVKKDSLNHIHGRRNGKPIVEHLNEVGSKGPCYEGSIQDLPQNNFIMNLI